MDRVRHKFFFSNIGGDPFMSSTMSIAIIGWIIGLAGSIAIVSTTSKVPPFTWWGIAFQICLIAGIIYVVGTHTTYIYTGAVLTCLGLATMYTTNSTNNFVWNGSAASGAAAAGHILMSICNILWILYFGTTDDARLHSFIDSFALQKDSSYGPSRYGGASYKEGTLSYSHGQSSRGYESGPPRTYSGMHTSSGGRGNSRVSMGMRQSGYSANGAYTGMGYDNSSEHENKLHSFSQDSTQSGPDDMAPVNYPYRARALYEYKANPEDQNELSFDKDEILEISDITGRWWQARRANGEVGICPSNYVTLITDQTDVPPIPRT